MANRHRHRHHHHHKALIKHCLMKLSSALQLTCIQTLRRNNNTIGPVKIKYTQWQIKLKASSLKVVKIEVIYSNHWVKSKVFRWHLKVWFDSTFQTLCGSELQAVGPATEWCVGNVTAYCSWLSVLSGIQRLQFLRCDAMHKCSLCRRALCFCLSCCLSRSCIFFTGG